MIELFVDTTSNLITVSLNKNGVINTKQQLSNMEHSNFVMVMIDNILKEDNITIKDVNKIIVCNGPGSFTGIRIGVSICKTIAYCLNIPITTISALEVMSINNDCLTLLHDNNNHYYYGFYKDNKIIKEGLDTLDNILNDKEVLGINKAYSKELYKDINTTIYNIDYKKIFEYCSNRTLVNPHHVNPYYLKLTSAQIGLLND